MTALIPEAWACDRTLIGVRDAFLSIHFQNNSDAAEVKLIPHLHMISI